MTAVTDAPHATVASKAVERRAAGVACGAHALHDGYTDLVYVMLPVWQAEFGIGYAALGLLRTCYSGTMAALPPEREPERGIRPTGDPTIRAIPSRRIGVPDDIANLAVFLCSPLSDYINGACLVCDGGFLVGGTP